MHVVHCEIIGVEHWNITQRCNNGIYGNVRVKSAIPFESQYTTAFLTSPASTQDFGAHRIKGKVRYIRKPCKFGHTFTNSGNPDETTPYEPSHQDFHCLDLEPLVCERSGLSTAVDLVPLVCEDVRS